MGLFGIFVFFFYFLDKFDRLSMYMVEDGMLFIFLLIIYSECFINVFVILFIVIGKEGKVFFFKVFFCKDKRKILDKLCVVVVFLI